MLKRIILHVGLPKTGTSALQRWADVNRAALLQQNIAYPETFAGGGATPKHQFLVQSLMLGQFTPLHRVLECHLSEALFMSTEGLSNHVYDFSEKAMHKFREVTKSYSITIFIVLRNKEKWTRSMYKQCVINPTNPRFNYGTKLRYEEFRILPRVSRMFDHDRLISDIQKAYGAREVVVACYEGNWPKVLFEALGVDKLPDMGRLSVANVSPPDDLVEIIRQVNGMELNETTREAFLALSQMTFQIQNELLLDCANKRSGTFTPVGILANILERLIPETNNQLDVIEAMRRVLTSSDWRDF